MDLGALNDQELLGRLQMGESWAMSVLYDRYARLVFSLALKVLNDRESAEEVVQEVFLKVWRRAGDYQPERGHFPGWLCGIAQHHAIDELRRRRVRPAAAEDQDAILQVADHGPVPYDQAVAGIEHQRITDALACIPADQRRPIELAYFQGYTQQEIAEMLHEPLGTVKTRMRLGMQKLKVLLDESNSPLGA